MSTLQRGPGERVQVLDEDGRVRDGATVPDLDEDQLIELYWGLRLRRHFDQRAVSLQRQGRIGTVSPLSRQGQEAARIGSALALDDAEWIAPSYREHAAAYARGIGLDRIRRYWMGDARGNRMDERDVIPHATGLAWAADPRGDDVGVCVYFGDGATSEGDFHKAMNVAGVFDVSAIFFCKKYRYRCRCRGVPDRRTGPRGGRNEGTAARHGSAGGRHREPAVASAVAGAGAGADQQT